MHWMKMVLAASLAFTGAAAGAQPNAERTNAELLRRLDQMERSLDRLSRDVERLERRLDEQEDRGEGGSRDDIVAAANELCGGSCDGAARRFCRRTGFANGVPLQIERRGIGNFEHVVRLRCFN